jgi:hypothetical protein
MNPFRYLWWTLQDKYYNVKYYIKFPNKWVTKVVPRSRYKDKTEIIEDVLYAAIVDFVEEEKCFQIIDWEYNDSHKQVGDFIRDCYKWIKIKRPELQKQIDDIIYKSPFTVKTAQEMIYEINNDKRTYEEKYPGLEQLKLQLKNKDTYYFTKIVEFREYLWT